MLNSPKTPKDRLQDVLQNRQDNYILPFFWQHGEEESVLRDYMNAIHNANIGAVCIESRPHPDFGGPLWWRDMDIILDEAKKLDMKVWILDDSHFPTGFANGAVLKASKELHHRYLAANTVEMAGPRPHVEVRIEDMIHPPVLPPWIPVPPNAPAPIGDDVLYGIYACEVMEDASLGTPVDLTDLVRDGVLVWDLPEGYWRIFFAYLTYDGRARDDYMNFLDMDSCRLLIDAVYEPHYEHYKELFGTVIAGFFSDEPPTGNTPGYTPAQQVGTDPSATLAWSEALPQRISGSYGSAQWQHLIPYLFAPAADQDTQARVRSAYMDAVSRLIQECFSLQVGGWCREHGVEYIGHELEDVDFNSHLGPSLGHFFRSLDGQDMAGIDNIGLSIEVGAQNTGRHNIYRTDEASFYHYVLGKLAASHAAIDDKKAGRSMCENFGAYGWQTGTRTMKYLLDELLVRGINHFVPHAFTPKDFPDPDCPPHFYAHGENPEYEAFGDLMLYANRICHLISGGREKPSVAILYHAEADWAGTFESNGKAARALSQDQIDYHIIPADVFNEREKYHTEWKDGKLCVNGVLYEALIISGSRYICKVAAEFAAEAEAHGFPVAVAGEIPAAISDCPEQSLPAAFDRLDAMNAADIPAWVRSHGIGDVTLQKKTPWMSVFHYDNGRDMYLFLNEDPAHSYEDRITVKSHGTPVLYDAWNNRLNRIISEDLGAEGTALNIHLAPLEMAVVLFDSDDSIFSGPAAPSVKLSEDAVSSAESDEMPAAFADFAAEADVTVLKDFTISSAEAKTYLVSRGTAGFDEIGTYPGEELPMLSDKLPDFSGWLRYETQISIDSIPSRAVLVLDDCYEYAKVYVNGCCAGSAGAAPYRYELTGLLKEGDNEIRIDAATNMERRVRAMGIDVKCMHVLHPYSPIGIVGQIRLFVK